MSEANTLTKLVIILGIVFLLIGLIYPGQDAAWTGFRSALSTGPSFPTFDNPFSGDRFEANYSIVGDGSVAPSSVTDTDTVPSCITSATPSANWWGCVVTKDEGVSFLTASTSGHQARLRMGNIDTANTYSVLAIKIAMECHGNAADRAVDIIFKKADDTTIIGEFPAQTMTCHVGPYENVSAIQQLDTPYPVVGDFQGGTVTINTAGSADFSYVSITFIVSGQADCTSGNTLAYVGCQIAGFFNFIVKATRFFVNGLVFLVSMLVALAVFTFRIATNLLFGLFATFAWFFAIPGAPPVVQVLIASIFVGLIAWILYVVMKNVTAVLGGIHPL